VIDKDCIPVQHWTIQSLNFSEALSEKKGDGT